MTPKRSSFNIFENYLNRSAKKRKIDRRILSIMANKSRYKWENGVYSPTMRRATTCDDSLNNDPSKITHKPSVPFNQVTSKGWFSEVTCNIDCIYSKMFDLRNCCFIRPELLPRNTLKVIETQNCNSTVPKKIKRNCLTNHDSLVSLSKHKLIRKLENIARDPPFILKTRRKLIRKSEIKPIDNFTNNVAERKTDAAEFRESYPLANAKRADSSFVVLTRSKLIRKQETASNVTGSESDSREKLISVSRNKLVKSSLLRTNLKLNESVLYHMIQYRRRPYPGSSYVLLARNKLIRRRKSKLKLWRKQSVIPNEHSRSSKPFVSVGSTKLIRKSLFSKNNKNGDVLASLPLRKTILARVLSSPSKRVQRFTNHLTRQRMKRFPNRCKNNKRLLRKKICPLYRKNGVCSKNSRGTCPMVHDRKYVVLCQKSLKGTCEDSTCTLSHDVVPQKVPQCLHYLRDNCVAEVCIYLHSNPQPGAPICAQYLRGYCELADKCPHWHVFACPAYKNSLKCENGDKCRLPHRSVAYFQKKVCGEEDETNWRYFEKNDDDDKDHCNVSIIPQREALGSLPDFIPL